MNRKKKEKMVLLNNPFWDHVEVLNDGGFKCKFCGQSFAPTTSITRIKRHFSGKKGHGVAICGRVPKRVQEEALEAMCGGNKRRKGKAGLININDAAISTCAPDQIGLLDIENADWAYIADRAAVASISQFLEVDGASSFAPLPCNNSHQRWCRHLISPTEFGSKETVFDWLDRL